MPQQKLMTNTILWILILLTVILALWMGFDVYRALNTPTPPELSEALIKPLDPNINTAVIEGLEKKVTFTEEQFSRIPQQRKSSFGAEISPSGQSTATSGAQTR